MNQITTERKTTAEKESSPAETLGDVYSTPIGEGIILHVCPGKQISWEEFKKCTPPHSIALDGLVWGKPQLDRVEKRANFNHHEEVERFATRCTTSQVFMAIKDGTLDIFKDPVSGAPRINIYVNDPDQDSSFAVWLLKHHERCKGTKSEPSMMRLLFAEDMLDTTAGLYPFYPDSKLARQMAWVFEPYVAARLDGRLWNMKGPEMANVIDAVGLRIDRYVLGEAESVPLDTRYSVIGGGPGWSMVKMVGFYARSLLRQNGITAYVAYGGEHNGRHKYSLGKLSPADLLPIKELYDYLNQLEGFDPGNGPHWGGSDTIGGSPRPLGSSLSPKELEQAINSFLERMNGELH
ncbi:MAG: hypothetical protein ACK5Y6_04530 [Pseudomonadota bacterium]|jgi:hypothetical protein